MRQKITALLETLIVFTLVVFLVRLVLAAPWELAGAQVYTQRYLSYLPVLALPLMLLIITRRNLPEYGLTLKYLSAQLRIAVICVPAILVISLSLYLLNWRRWEYSALVALIEVGVLLLIVRLLRGQSAMIAATIVLPAVGMQLPASATDMSIIVLQLVYSISFVALGEELLYRGYIQTHLNKVFGKPFQFGGVQWGWGVIITALLFGLWHVLNPWNPFSSQWLFSLPWGIWTFVCALILGYVREKTGAVWAPAILHAVINL